MRLQDQKCISASNSKTHLIVVSRLQQQLNALNAAGRLLVQQPVRVPDFDEPQPDLTVLRLPLGRTRPEAIDCELVIEVSDTTLKFDREEKVHAYRTGGVPRVWIVNLAQHVVEEYGSPTWTAEVYHPHAGELQVAGIRIDLSSLFGGIESDG